MTWRKLETERQVSEYELNGPVWADWKHHKSIEYQADYRKTVNLLIVMHPTGMQLNYHSHEMTGSVIEPAL